MEESVRRYDMLGGHQRMRFLGRFSIWDFLVTVAAMVPWVVFAARGSYAADDAPVWLLRMAWYGGGLAALELLRLFYSRTVLDIRVIH